MKVSVDADLDTAIETCLVRIPCERDFGLSQRKAIYRPSPGSYPPGSGHRLGTL